MKKLLSITLALMLVLSVMAVPAFAKEVSNDFLDTSLSAKTIQFSEGGYPTDGAYAAKTGWGTNHAADHFSETPWARMEDDGSIILNTSKFPADDSAVLRHLVDASGITTDSVITFSFDFKFLNKASGNPYVIIGLNGYQNIPLYLTPSDCWVGANERAYGGWGSYPEGATGHTMKLSSNTDYHFTADYTWNESQSKYDMAYKITQGSTVVLQNSCSAAQNGKALATPDIQFINIDIATTGSKTASTSAEDILKFSNFKLTETHTVEDIAEKGAVKFDNAGLSEKNILIDDTFAEQEFTHVAWNGVDNNAGLYASISDSGVLAGNKWMICQANAENEKPLFVEDGWLMVKPLQQTGNKNWRQTYEWRSALPKVVKCFTPITDGSAFTIKSTIKPLKSKLPTVVDSDGTTEGKSFGFSAQLRLTNDTSKNTGSYLTNDATQVFNIFTYSAGQDEKYVAAVAGVGNRSSSAVNILGETYGAMTDYGWDIPVQGKTLEVKADFIPDGDNYNVSVTCTDIATGEVVLANTAPVVVPKDTVSTYSRLQISVVNDTCVEATTEQLALRYIGFKDVSFAKYDNVVLADGDNTLYVPYKRLTGTYFDALVIAAVYNEDGSLASVKLENINNEETKNGNAAITVNVTDASKQYVKCFAFDDLNNITPLIVSTPNKLK